MEAADLEEVAAIDDASFRGSQLTVERLEDELARPWARCWVAHGAGGKVVGFVVTWFVVDEVHVLNVATHPAHRRRGVGRLLMQHVIATAQANGSRHVMLEVRRSNVPAMRLYRRLSFSAMGVRRDYYPDGEDAVEMVLAFDPQTRTIVEGKDEIRLDLGDL